MKLVLLAAASRQDPIWVYPVALGGLALIGLVLWLLNRIVTHFFPSTKNYHASAGNALMRVGADFLPGGHEHVVEVCERDEAEEDDQGDPPETGSIELVTVNRSQIDVGYAGHCACPIK